MDSLGCLWTHFLHFFPVSLADDNHSHLTPYVPAVAGLGIISQATAEMLIHVVLLSPPRGLL